MSDYVPESYISPCRWDPFPFDLVLDNERRTSADAIDLCRKLCAQCHPEHRRTCLETYLFAPGVVAGLTLEQRSRLRRNGHPMVPVRYRGAKYQGQRPA